MILPLLILLLLAAHIGTGVAVFLCLVGGSGPILAKIKLSVMEATQWIASVFGMADEFSGFRKRSTAYFAKHTFSATLIGIASVILAPVIWVIVLLLMLARMLLPIVR